MKVLAVTNRVIRNARKQPFLRDITNPMEAQQILEKMKKESKDLPDVEIVKVLDDLYLIVYGHRPKKEKALAFARLSNKLLSEKAESNIFHLTKSEKDLCVEAITANMTGKEPEMKIIEGIPQSFGGGEMIGRLGQLLDALEDAEEIEVDEKTKEEVKDVQTKEKKPETEVKAKEEEGAKDGEVPAK